MDDDNLPRAAGRRATRWDAVAAIIASLIGFLALLVAGYTAYVQRYTADIQAEQVRAQVWPLVIAGSDDESRSLVVFNKGVGPAIVREAQMLVDGTPQPNWEHVLDALKVAMPRDADRISLNPGVLSPGDRVPIIRFDATEAYVRFRVAAIGRLRMKICYCSALNQCWIYDDAHPVGPKNGMPRTDSVERCPTLPEQDVFFD